MLDILIKNGYVIDGTGNHGYQADIGVKDGRIVQIEKDIKSEACDVIDAHGLIVCPGFIDAHSHNDLVPFMGDKLKGLKIMQGVTTELVGQCGLGVVPCIEEGGGLWKSYVRGIVGDIDEEWKFSNLKDYMKQISLKGLKNNYSVLVSQGAVKASVMGFDSSKPSKAQLDKMCEIADDAMESGAFGMSLGLQYMPAIFSSMEELTEICKVIKKHNGILMVHLRNHDNTMVNAMDEIFEIAKASRVKLHISHMRSYNSKDFGCPAETLINYVEKARESGITITFDEHLYLSGSTLLTQLFPPSVIGSGKESIVKNLRDKLTLQRLKEELTDKSLRYSGWDNYSAITGWNGILITSLKKKENLKYIGRTIGDVADEIHVHPVDFAAKLLVEEGGGVGIVTLNVFSEEDTFKLIRHPLQMVGSDSIPAGVPHPRLYGNFPLFIGKFVRQKKILSLEKAIYKSTLLPAKTIGFKDIGQLSVGKSADITIFDFNEIKGYEDYKNPTKPPEGIKYVILNGKLSIKNSRLCHENNGKILRYNS